MIEERRKIPKAERLKQFRDDSVDEIDTTDLENFAFRGMTRNDYNKWKRGELRDPNSPIEVMNRKLYIEERARKKIEKTVRPRSRRRDREIEEGKVQTLSP